MAKRSFFYRLDAAEFLGQVHRAKSDKALADWVRSLAMQLVTHDGDNEFAAQLIAEAADYTAKRAAAGAAGNAKRWHGDGKGIAERSQSNHQATADLSPVAVAEAVAEAGSVLQSGDTINQGGRVVVATRAQTREAPQPLDQRCHQFKASLSNFAAQYSRETLAAFAAYWTEPNRNRTKARWELEKTWDTGRRLATWASREQVPGRYSGTAATLGNYNAVRGALALEMGGEA